MADDDLLDDEDVLDIPDLEDEEEDDLEIPDEDEEEDDLDDLDPKHLKASGFGVDDDEEPEL